MLPSLQKTVRIRATSALTSISTINKVNTHSRTTLLTAHRSKLIRAHDIPFSAPFSAHSHGLRKIMSTEYTCADLYQSSDKRFVVNARSSIDTESSLGAGPDDAARFAFEQSNPFGDPEAHNCLIVFEHVVEDGFRIYGYIVKEHIAAGFLQTKAKILQDGLNNAVRAAGKSVSWIHILCYTGIVVQLH